MEKEQILEAVKLATSPQELQTIAKENGIELTEETATDYFNTLKLPNEEMSLEDLDDITGGVIHWKKKPKTTGTKPKTTGIKPKTAGTKPDIFNC